MAVKQPSTGIASSTPKRSGDPMPKPFNKKPSHSCNAIFAFLIALGLAGLGSITARAADKPNFVLIFADDLGINDLSCYGRKDQPTPNLDRMASEGTRFTCGYCSQPICSPSRAGIMT